MTAMVRFPLPHHDALDMAERCWNKEFTAEEEFWFQAREDAEEAAHRAKVGRPLLWEIQAQKRAKQMGAVNDAI